MAPRLPEILRSVEEQLDLQTSLLSAAQATPAGTVFTFGRRRYEHVLLNSLRENGGTYRGSGRVWINDLATDERIDLTRQEDLIFWAWAAINTVYYTGMRLEELTELTSTALFTYRLPDTGEVLPLLQIAPSKSDKERVLMVPPELAHVLARVKQRARDGGDTVPLTVRYGPYERSWTAPLPFLFQRRHGTQRRVISAPHLAALISKVIQNAGITGVDGELIELTTHDFRRVFATEAVAGGLPTHIVAKLLGHDSVTTTEYYAAIYPEDVIRHFHGFIARRRALRPPEEYRDPTDSEWEEFHQHFQRRKVEVGTCGRGYGTPCQHEHAPLTERSMEIVQYKAQIRVLGSTVGGRDGRSSTRAGSVEAEGSSVGSAGGDRRPVRALPTGRRRRRGCGAGRSVLPGTAGGGEGGGDGPLLRYGPAAVVALPAGGRRAVGSGDAGFSCWIQVTVKPRATAAKRRPARTIGAPNPVTGKPTPGPGYAPSTVAHSETVLRRFYDLHRDVGSGPRSRS